MKRIIQGKRYNTETAEEVASYNNGLGAGDFQYLCEELYVTDRGSWFLAGEGGPATKYSKSAGNMTSGGSDLIPLTAEEARHWLERHGVTSALEEYFGDLIVDA